MCNSAHNVIYACATCMIYRFVNIKTHIWNNGRCHRSLLQPFPIKAFEPSREKQDIVHVHVNSRYKLVHSTCDSLYPSGHLLDILDVLKDCPYKKNKQRYNTYI